MQHNSQRCSTAVGLHSILHFECVYPRGSNGNTQVKILSFYTWGWRRQLAWMKLPAQPPAVRGAVLWLPSAWGLGGDKLHELSAAYMFITPLDLLESFTTPSPLSALTHEHWWCIAFAEPPAENDVPTKALRDMTIILLNSVRVNKSWHNQKYPVELGISAEKHWIKGSNTNILCP